MSTFENGGGARAKVNAPATALLVTGIIGIVLQLVGLTVNLSGIAPKPAPVIVNQPGQPAPPFDPNYLANTIRGPTAIVTAIIGLVIGIVVILGANKMKNLESYGLAMTSSILAMIPCISPCCILGLPFGIWSLVVLTKPEVKQAFRS